MVVGVPVQEPWEVVLPSICGRRGAFLWFYDIKGEIVQERIESGLGLERQIKKESWITWLNLSGRHHSREPTAVPGLVDLSEAVLEDLEFKRCIFEELKGDMKERGLQPILRPSVTTVCLAQPSGSGNALFQSGPIRNWWK